jgi:hypothetical protein
MHVVGQRFLGEFVGILLAGVFGFWFECPVVDTAAHKAKIAGIKGMEDG